MKTECQQCVVKIKDATNIYLLEANVSRRIKRRTENCSGFARIIFDTKTNERKTLEQEGTQHNITN